MWAFIIISALAVKIVTVGWLPDIQGAVSAILAAIALLTFAGDKHTRSVFLGTPHLFGAFLLLLFICLCSLLIASYHGFPIEETATACMKLAMIPSLIVLGVYVGRVSTAIRSLSFIVAISLVVIFASLIQFYMGAGTVDIGGVARLSGLADQADLLANLCSTIVILSVYLIFLNQGGALVRGTFWCAAGSGSLVLILNATLKNVLVTFPVVIYLLIVKGKIGLSRGIAMVTAACCIVLSIDSTSLVTRVTEVFDTGIYVGNQGEYLGNSFNWRLLQWSLVISDWWTNYALFGSGLGQIVNMDVLQSPGGKGYSAHNDYLNFLAELGFIGMLAFCVFNVKMAKVISKTGLYRPALSSAAVALLICGMFGPVYFTTPFLYVMPFAVGSCLACRNK